VTGSDGEAAHRLAVAIGEWVGAEDAARTQESLAAEYRAAGRDYRPPGEAAETVDELQHVLGMTPAVFAEIKPHLSLFAPATPNLARADPVVAAALAMADPIGSATARPDREPQTLIARISVTAVGPNNVHATRNAVVRVTPRSRTYTVLSWNPT